VVERRLQLLPATSQGRSGSLVDPAQAIVYEELNMTNSLKIKFASAALAALGTLTFASGAAAAGYHSSSSHETDTHYDYAPVTDVQPIMESVEVSQPRRECRVERVAHKVPVNSGHSGRSHRTHRSYTPEIVGAVIGGAVGRKVGRGRGQDVATVLGAVLGGSIGRDVNKRGSYRHNGGHATRYETRYEDVETCRTVDNYHTEERVVGYKVQYRYDGKQYWTQKIPIEARLIAVAHGQTTPIMRAEQSTVSQGDIKSRVLGYQQAGHLSHRRTAPGIG